MIENKIKKKYQISKNFANKKEYFFYIAKNFSPVVVLKMSLLCVFALKYHFL